MSSIPQKYEVTPHQFDLFKREAERFLALFGLLDWSVFFEHKKLDEITQAECEFWHGDSRKCILRLTTELEYELTEDEIKKSAFHEVWHVMLADSVNAVCWDDLSPEQTRAALSRAHHALIHRMEHVVFPLLKD